MASGACLDVMGDCLLFIDGESEELLLMALKGRRERLRTNNHLRFAHFQGGLKELAQSLV
jgi:hypothetical protein